jgi:nitrous oxide reductase accessory protein NosL
MTQAQAQPLPEEERNATVALYADLAHAEHADAQRACELLTGTEAGYMVDSVAESQMEGEDLCPWSMRRLDSRWCWC